MAFARLESPLVQGAATAGIQEHASRALIKYREAVMQAHTLTEGCGQSSVGLVRAMAGDGIVFGRRQEDRP